MAKTKILYLITQSEWGGGQEYVFNLASNLLKDQFEPIVMAGEGTGEFFKALKSQNLPYTKLKWVKRSINPIFDLMALFELIFVFKKEQPDVIHLNSSKIGFLGSLAAKLCFSQAKIIYTAHGWVFNEPIPYLIKKIYFWIEKISASWKNEIICVCESDKQIALQNNFHSRITTIHNAVNPEQLDFLTKDEAREKLNQLLPLNLRVNFFNQPPTSPLIGAIANFYKTKGLDFLISAAGLLKKNFPALKIVIIGEGEERKNLELRIKNLELSNNVILTGNIPNAHRLLKAFDLFVLPSVKEGLPYAILKAMAAELPIVATRVGGLPEILPNECLVELGNAAIMAEKIKTVLVRLDSARQAGRLEPVQYSADSFREFLSKTLSLYL